jgi:hypothetical protein
MLKEQAARNDSVGHWAPGPARRGQEHQLKGDGGFLRFSPAGGLGISGISLLMSIIGESEREILRSRSERD